MTPGAPPITPILRRICLTSDAIWAEFSEHLQLCLCIAHSHPHAGVNLYSPSHCPMSA